MGCPPDAPARSKPHTPIMGSDTVVVITGRATDRTKLRSEWNEWLRALPTGFLGATAGVTHDRAFIAMARFASAHATRHIPPLDGLQHLDSELAIEHCPRTDTWNRGGSDTAGFVQIRRGSSCDPGRLRDLYVNQQPVRMGPFRPEVLGGMFAWHDGNRFTLSAYFTSEDAARGGENLDQFRSFFDDISAVMQNLTYFDLHHPWLA